MKTSLLAISLLLVSHTLPVWASEAPASELSVREMLHITQTEQNYRDTMVQAPGPPHSDIIWVRAQVPGRVLHPTMR